MAYWETLLRSAERHIAWENAVRWLQRGEVVAFPTDTVYGVGVLCTDPAAVRRLFQVKERPLHLAIPLLLAAVADLERFCVNLPALLWPLVERFWPGPLSLVLWRHAALPGLLTAGRPTVAVRLPDHPLPRYLASRLGGAIAASSANLSGRPAPVTADQVLTQLGGRLPLILDGGPCPGGQPSTLLDLTTDPPRLLRPGPLRRESLEAVLGKTILEPSEEA